MPVTGPYPGLHYFRLGLPNLNSCRSRRGLLVGPKRSGFHYSLASFSLLLSIFHYHTINCHHYQSSKLVHASSQAPKKNEDRPRGKMKSDLKTLWQSLGGWVLEPSRYAADMLLGGSDRRTTRPVGHPHLVADLVDMESASSQLPGKFCLCRF